MRSKKYLVILSIVLSVFVSCKKETSDGHVLGNDPQVRDYFPTETKPTPLPANGKYAEMTFGHETHDFGTIKQGSKVSCIFQFKNTGGSDLVITHAKGSCGCTVPEYSKTPILPGKIGEIKVTFNSAGKIGDQTKSVTIFCNTKEGVKVLHIKSNIVPNGTK